MRNMTTADLRTLKTHLQKIEPQGLAEGYAIGRLIYRVEAAIMERELADNVVRLRAM